MTRYLQAVASVAAVIEPVALVFSAPGVCSSHALPLSLEVLCIDIH